MEEYKGFRVILAVSRKSWRKWLQDHHGEGQSVWLVIFHTDSGIPSVTYDEAVDEALCFGWIDSKPNKRDSHSHYQFFSPRNPKRGILEWIFHAKRAETRARRVSETAELASRNIRANQYRKG